MCKISVILPVYNGEDYIGESIESVLNQTFEDIELIVVNDCSVDNTREIVERYAESDSRIIIMNNERNLKLPASLNSGFAKARGKYLTWTSHDNRYLPDALYTMYHILENNDTYGMVYCNCALIDDDGNVLRDNYLREPDELIWGNVVGACFLYRKTVMEMVGEYDTDLFLAEDYDYWLRIFSVTQLFHCAEIQYQYRCNSKSLSATRLKDVKSQTAKLWIKHKDIILKHLQSRDERYSFYDRIYNYSGKSDKKAVKKYLTASDKSYYLHFIKMMPFRVWNSIKEK